MLKIRDDEDCKALARMGFPRPVDQEEAMKLGFPIIDTGFMPPVTMGMDTDTHMPGGSNPGVGKLRS